MNKVYLEDSRGVPNSFSNINATPDIEFSLRHIPINRDIVIEYLESISDKLYYHKFECIGCEENEEIMIILSRDYDSSKYYLSIRKDK